MRRIVLWVVAACALGIGVAIVLVPPPRVDDVLVRDVCKSTVRLIAARPDEVEFNRVRVFQRPAELSEAKRRMTERLPQNDNLIAVLDLLEEDYSRGRPDTKILVDVDHTGRNLFGGHSREQTICIFYRSFLGMEFETVSSGGEDHKYDDYFWLNPRGAPSGVSLLGEVREPNPWDRLRAAASLLSRR